MKSDCSAGALLAPNSNLSRDVNNIEFSAFQYSLCCINQGHICFTENDQQRGLHSEFSRRLTDRAAINAYRPHYPLLAVTKVAKRSLQSAVIGICGRYLHGLFQPSEAVLTREVFESTSAMLRDHGLDRQGGRDALARVITEEVVDRLGDEWLQAAILVQKAMDQ